jgi:hypothetical protein
MPKQLSPRTTARNSRKKEYKPNPTLTKFLSQHTHTHTIKHAKKAVVPASPMPFAMDRSAMLCS